MTAIALGPVPTLAQAVESIYRVGALVGGVRAQVWAAELRQIAVKLDEGSPWGPNGSTWRLEGARLALAATIAEYGWEREQALMGAKALAAVLPVLEGQASGDDALDVLAIRLDLEATVGEEFEQIALRPSGLDRKAGFEGKVFAGWSASKERDFERFMRRIGGYVPRTGGAREPGPFGWDAIHFGRAQALICGDAEPDGDAETRALRRWREKYG